MGTLLLLLVIVLLAAALPTWPYSHTWGFAPSSTIGIILVVLLVLLLLGKI